MSDPRRTDTSRPSDAGPGWDRDAKIEQLLLDGLDHYFGARHDQAINIWTRALFLDRNHARARAYIERARAALAERQRESEELLQGGVAALHRGEVNEARRLLEDAIGRGAPSEDALAALERVNRIEQGAVTGPETAAAPTPTPAPAPRGAPAASTGTVSRPIAAWLASAAVLLLAGTLLVASRRVEWRAPFALRPSPSTAGPLTAVAEFPLPRRGEIALLRARALVRAGRLRDALVALDLVRMTDAQKPEADRLRAEIQRQLIALSIGQERSLSRETGSDGTVR